MCGRYVLAQKIEVLEKRFNVIIPAGLMNAYPVSPEIKNPRANSKVLIEPKGEKLQSEIGIRTKSELRLQGMGNPKRKS